MSRLKELEDAQISSDVRRMMHLVRTALSRDIGGISNASLYNHTHTGTKHLVERYIKTSVDLIQTLIDRTRSAAALPKGLTHREMLDQLLLARRSYGRSALILSGGSVYGMAHIGVLKALYERRLLPRIISGTSAGSIVAAVVCTRTDEEIPEMLQRFAHGDLSVFTDKDNPESWLTHISRALRYGSWHDSRHIARVMRDLMGDITFQEAFNRTRRILNITVSSKRGLQLPSLLNYLTAPDVIIWSAVVASCSIPGVFDPRPLLVRDAETGEHVPWDPAEQLWIDGSLDNDVPVERLGEMLNVNHFIVSQTNPHIVLFVSSDEKGHGANALQGQGHTAVPSLSEILYTIGWLSKSEAIYYLETLVDMGLFRGGLSMLLQMLNQRYTADINILPRMSLAWSTNLIRNPTPEFMLEACRVGEQATWPSISRIEQACAVELALDRAVYILRERIAFSDSQVNLRRFFTGSYELGVRGSSFTATTPVAVGAPGPDNTCSVDSSDGDTDPALSSAMTSLAMGAAPAFSGTGSPNAYRTSQYHQHRRHKRRGSGGSIQLSARRRHNRYELETVLSEDGGGHDSVYYPQRDRRGSSDAGQSLAARRGMEDLNLSDLLDHGQKQTARQESVGVSSGVHISGASNATATPRISQANSEMHIHRLTPSYRATGKQNSLQHLPISSPSNTKTPSPAASFTRRAFNWGFGDKAAFPGGGGGLTPFASLGNDDNNDDAVVDEDDSPLLQMKSGQRQRQRRKSSTSSAVSAVSAAAAAAVVAAHQAVMQAVSGSSGGSSASFSTMTEPMAPQAEHARNGPLTPSASGTIPLLSRLSSTDWYPGIPSRAPQQEDDDGDMDASEDDTSGDLDPYEDDRVTYASRTPILPRTPPRRPLRLVRRCKSVPAMAMSAADTQLSLRRPQPGPRRAAPPLTPPQKQGVLSDESLSQDQTDVDEDSEVNTGNNSESQINEDRDEMARMKGVSWRR